MRFEVGATWLLAGQRIARYQRYRVIRPSGGSLSASRRLEAVETPTALRSYPISEAISLKVKSGRGTDGSSATPRRLIQAIVRPSGLPPTRSVNCDWPECSISFGVDCEGWERPGKPPRGDAVGARVRPRRHRRARPRLPIGEIAGFTRIPNGEAVREGSVWSSR